MFQKSGTQKMLCTLFLILLDCAHIKDDRTSHDKYSAQGIQNPATDWNLESKIRYPATGIWNPQRVIQNPGPSWFTL